jgi:hypothetical protein
VSGILFLLPCLLLVAAWRRATSGLETGYPKWRRHCADVALFAATVATVAEMLFMFSWLYNGGSPHGMDPSPGLWMRLRPAIKWPFVLGVVLTLFGKGKLRLLLLGWVPSVVFAMCATYMLQMD